MQLFGPALISISPVGSHVILLLRSERMYLGVEDLVAQSGKPSEKSFCGRSGAGLLLLPK